MRQSSPMSWRTNAMIKFTEAKEAAPKGVARKGDEPIAKSTHSPRPKPAVEPEVAKSTPPKRKKGARRQERA